MTDLGLEHEIELEKRGKRGHILRCVLCGRVFGEREIPRADCEGVGVIPEEAHFSRRRPPVLGIWVDDGVTVREELG